MKTREGQASSAPADFSGDRLFGSQFRVLVQEHTMTIERIGVIGAGTMGNGIAHVFARSGYQVILCDVEQKFLDRGVSTISKNLDRELAKNKITEAQKSEALKRIEGTVDRNRLSACDLI